MGTAEGRVFAEQRKGFFTNIGSPFLAAEGCSAGGRVKGEFFWEHQRDYSGGSSTEPSSVINIIPKSLNPPGDY